MTSTPRLTLRRPISGVVTITTAQSAPIEQWDDARACVVQAAFAGRDVAFLLHDPPLEWGDIDLEALSPDILALSEGELSFTLAFAEDVTPETLEEAASSSDFQHGGLLIAALTKQHAARFVAALAHARAHFPSWEEYVNLAPAALESLFRAELERQVQSGVEFLDCDPDGESLTWVNPAPESFALAEAALRAFALERGWQVDTPAVRG